MLTRKEIDDFMTHQTTITVLEKQCVETRDKLINALIKIAKAYNKIWGRPSDPLWVDDVEFNPDGSIDFDSNWDFDFELRIDDLLDPDAYISVQSEYKIEQDKKDAAKKEKAKQRRLEKKAVDEKVKQYRKKLLKGETI